jgi:poly-gamma-glutamate capsule biosynthesis protein CapA/YwtB (metallophosphatase superfamily)
MTVGEWEKVLPVGLSVVLLLATAAWMVRDRLSARGRRLLQLGVVVAFLGGVGNYFDFGDFRYGRFVNPHDVYHYYIGAKYAPEHHYTNLYRATVLAQLDAGLGPTPQKVRNLETHEHESVRDVRERRAEVVAAFTPERWDALVADVAVFHSLVPATKWSAMLTDKGYNPTPVWNLVGHAVSEAVPVDSAWGLHAITALDLVLIAVVGGVVGAALGWEAGLLALAYIGLNVFGHFVHIKGAFLRFDWLVALVGAVVALQRGRGLLAGVLVAWAAMVRVFPVLFAAGPALLFAESVLRRRPPPPVLARFGLGLLGGAVVFFLCTLPSDGLALWTAFVHKMAVHAGDLSSNRMGLLYVILDAHHPHRAESWARAVKPWAAVGVLVLWAAAVRRRSPAGALAWGVVPVFALTEATFYYYTMLVVPFVWLLSRDGTRDTDRGFAVSAVGLVGLSTFGLVRTMSLPHNFPYFHELSIGVGVVFGLFALAALPGPAGAASLSDFLLRPVLALRRRPALVVGGVVAGVLLWVGNLAVLAAYDSAIAKLAEPAAADDERDLVFVGDIMLSRNVAASLERFHRPPDSVFDAAREHLQAADFTFGNLECPVSGRSEPIDKRYVFNASPEVVPAIENAGFDVVSLANNHTLDYGTLALEDTVRHLEGSAVAHVGLSHGDAPQTPHITDLDGITVGTLAYCDPVPGYSCAKEFDAFAFGPAKVSPKVFRRDIAALREKVDIVVVSMHWGTEYKRAPGKRQRKLARALIRAGADIVAGHHPHVQQDAEWVDGRLVIYSMGNFVFDQRKPHTDDSRLYRVVVGPEGVRRAGYLPLTIDSEHHQPRPDQDNYVPVPSLQKLLGW